MTKAYYLPAEWHHQRCLQLTWPHAATDWAPYLNDITETMLQLADAVSRQEPMIIVTADADATRSLLAARLSPKQMEQVTLYECPTNDTWARDHGGITLLPTDGEGQPLILDYRFNGWGEKFPSQLDNAITPRLHQADVFNGYDMKDCEDFVLEGGSIESDGKGTLFTTAPCLLAPHRNQPMDESEIEERLKADMGVQRVVWLHHGMLIGDDTDGHIDTLVRTAPNDTLLYVAPNEKDAEGDDDAKLQYNELKLMEEELQTLRNDAGKPFRLLPLPCPDAICYDGERLPATYANFVIVNGAVIVPQYGQERNDRTAMQQIQLAFPDRKMVGIDANTVIRQHGSLHCLTMQYPL